MDGYMIPDYGMIINRYFCMDDSVLSDLDMITNECIGLDDRAFTDASRFRNIRSARFKRFEMLRQGVEIAKGIV